MPAGKARLQTPSATAADWAVVAFGVGIALYFALPTEPSLWVAVLVAGTLGLLATRTRGLTQLLLAATLFASLGLARATWHTQVARAPTVASSGLYADVTGWIEATERGASGPRWIVRVHTTSIHETPHRVRVSIPEDLVEAHGLGQGVAFRARLWSPPPPAVPGGYDAARAAYFKGIGAYGRVVGEVDTATIPSSAWDTIPRTVATWRGRIGARIASRAPPDTAGLQVALVTGQRHLIPPTQVEALRDAGLAHLIAISGLHMAMFAGLSYTALSWLFAGLPGCAARDMRKPAAALALLVATAYLALSGASVSTQRAFIMIAVMLSAILLDRQPFSLRSVSVAAFLVLILHPEALLSAGFHMSFAAVVALVVAYGAWNARRERLPSSPARRVVNALASLSATSLIAGLATAGFAVIHFGRLARYGLAANLAAMPVFSALTMPAAMVALLLMPLGLEAAPLWVMGKSLSAILWVAETVSSWPGAVAHWTGATGPILAVFAAGLTLFLLGRNRVRIAGLATLALIPLTAYHAPQADLRVGSTGTVTVRIGEHFHTDRPRSDRFGRDIWLRETGHGEVGKGEAANLHPLTDIAACDDLGCDFTLKDTAVAIRHHPAEVADACATADLVILTTREAVAPTRRACNATLIDARSLKATGPVHIALTGKRHQLTARRGRRPW